MGDGVAWGIGATVLGYFGKINRIRNLLSKNTLHPLGWVAEWTKAAVLKLEGAKATALESAVFYGVPCSAAGVQKSPKTAQNDAYRASLTPAPR